jgi:hypothetical protein
MTPEHIIVTAWIVLSGLLLVGAAIGYLVSLWRARP